MQSHKLQFQAVKTGLWLSFYHKKRDTDPGLDKLLCFCAHLPREGRGAIFHHPLCVSCHLRAAPMSSAWWRVTLAARAEGWDVRPCLSFLQTQSGPEQLETSVFYVPLALFCSLPAHRVHWLLLLSLTNAIINLRTLLLDHSNILFKTIIWKITWQRTVLLFLLWKRARFTKGLQAGLG